MDRRIRVVVSQLEALTLPPNPPSDSTTKQRYAVSPAKVSVEALAVTVNLSGSRLRALFKAETGQTIAQYLKRLRLQRAKELAATTFLRSGEIAALLEFDHPSHFVREFRRAFGVTPGAYRKTINEGPEQSAHSPNNHLSC